LKTRIIKYIHIPVHVSLILFILNRPLARQEKSLDYALANGRLWEIRYYLAMLRNNSHFVIKQERGVFVIKVVTHFLIVTLPLPTSAAGGAFSMRQGMCYDDTLCANSSSCCAVSELCLGLAELRRAGGAGHLFKERNITSGKATVWISRLRLEPSPRRAGLFARGRSRVYTGKYLDAISMPLGGIVGGNVQINGKAQLFTQSRKGNTQTKLINVRYGKVRVASIVFQVSQKTKPTSVTVLHKQRVVTATQTISGDEVVITLEQPVVIKAGESLRVEID
jgi:hypothetical protein